MKKHFYLFFVVFYFIGNDSYADVIFNPRVEEISGSTVLASRLITITNFNKELGPYRFYFDGFAEFESQKTEADLRNINQGVGYLQEAYLEFKLGSFFLKGGRQAYRWSEMWTLPSLDIWTGRRFNRLFYDPLSEQLSHSTGITVAFVKENWSIDAALISEVGETTYPYPLSLNKNLSQKNDLANPEGGFRFKQTSGALGVAEIVAQIDKKNYYGFAANYALDKIVPKIEIGLRQDTSSTVLPERKNDYLGSIGCDIFFENWTFTPQLTTYDYGDQAQLKSYWQNISYVSAQWNQDKHEFQIQAYYNFQSKDSFVNISYGYHVKEFMTVTFFAQNYDGQEGTLFGNYKTITGGALAGIRAQFFSGFSF